MDDILFQQIPEEYKIAINSIQDAIIQCLYSKFVFSSHHSILNKKESNDPKKKLEKCTLFDFIKDCKFITYQYIQKDIDFNHSSENENQLRNDTSSKVDVIFCIESNNLEYEGRCLILNDLNIELFQMIENQLKDKKTPLINCCSNSENQNIKEEINSFCSNFLREIRINSFVKRTIRPIICYMIRRHFYPSNYFKNNSFFTYKQSKKQAEINFRKRICDFWRNHLHSKDRESPEIRHNKYEGDGRFLLEMAGELDENKYDDYNDKIEKKNFKKDDFICLRLLYSNERSTLFYLAIHLDSFHIFCLKLVNCIDQFEHEINFCMKYYHRCMPQFYGFVFEESKKVGFVYEFICNGTLAKYNISNELFSLMTVNRISQVIEYLHSNSLIHRDLKPFNILLDHDYLPYVVDFETIRHPSENGDMTGDITPLKYMSPEQSRQANVSFPSDIYSFGLIIYFLSEKKDIDLISENEEAPPISLGSNMFKELYKQCIEYDPSKRPTSKDIRLRLTLDFISTYYFDNYLTDKVIKFEKNFNLALEFDLMSKFIYELKFLESYKSNLIVLIYISQIDYRLFSPSILDSPSDLYYFIAGKYNGGHHVEQNITKAIEFYEKAANHGNKNAYFDLGEIYYDDENIEQDFSKAKFYYEKAAENDNTDAIEKLGIMYLDGIGVEKNEKKASEYFELADFLNNETALTNSFERAFNEEDYVTCLRYAKLLCKNEPYYFIFCGFFYQFGIGTKIDHSKAKEYYEMGAKEDDEYCINMLGEVYENGIGTPKDFLRAKYYYEEAAEMNCLDAIINLGSLYYKGLGVKQSYTKAKEYYEIAAKQSNSKAIYKLGELYYNGEGVKKDFSVAKRYFERSAQLNYSKAYLKLGEIYRDGIDIKPDNLKMIYYYELASQANNLKAILFLADLYSAGEIVEVNIKKSIQLFSKIDSIYKNQFKKAECFYDEPFYGYDHIANNDLGLIYITVSQDIEKGTNLIRAAALSEYSFARNNSGLIYQYYNNDIEKAEIWYKRSSENEFALAEYNLGNLCEINGENEKSIEYFISASEHQNSPLIFRSYNHYDKRLEISKLFILCLTNLKLMEYYFNIYNYEKSNEYFDKSISLINDQKTNYKFKFEFPKIISKNAFHSIKLFILGFPLFNLFNQVNLKPILDEYRDELDFLDKFTNEVSKRKKIEKPDEEQINKYDDKTNEISKNKFDIKQMKIIDNNYIDKNEDDEEETCFKDPRELFDYIIEDEELKSIFIKEIHDIVKIMKDILYKPPYSILFGRISIEVPRATNTSKKIDINDEFYLGLGTDIYIKES